MKTQAVLFFFCSALCNVLQAAPLQESGAVSSTHASYDGNALILKGKVMLDHGLGKMNAEHASLEKQEIANKDFPFSFIHLQKDVLLDLKTNAQIRCDRADLDFTTLKGLLYGGEKEKVIYTDTLKKKTAQFFQLISNQVELSFAKKEQADQKVDYDIETILAKEDVIIDYAKEFTVQADHALYRKSSGTTGTSSKEFQGTVTAYPKDADHPCRMTHEGDVIDADSIDLNMMHSKLSMRRPRGILLSRLIPHAQKGEIHFKSNYLLWDHLKNILTLKGQIYIQEDALGELKVDDEMQVIQQIQEGKRVLKMIRAKGKTLLHYKDAQDNSSHQLMCFGTLKIDREKLNGFLDSPEMNGRVAEDQQIHYEGNEMTAFSDKAYIEYSLVEESLQPVSLALKGNIRLTSAQAEAPTRCALSDRLSYSPSTHTLILSADPGKKVLFWDEQQSLHISAAEVHITRDPNTHKDSIKGVGNVKFTLTGEENSALKKIFPFFKEVVHEPQ